MAKIYSLLLVIFAFSFSLSLQAQNVGIGTSNPLEKLEVNGAIRIGTTVDPSYTGTIRYNTTTNIFEGRDNVGWKPFAGSSAGDYWTKVGTTPPSTNSDDVFHTGNVGIGTSIPIAKLHVKGNGATAVRAETTNSNDTIPAVYAINTDSTGYALRAVNKKAINHLGGNAALVIGDFNMQGAIRNTDAGKYGGSVAVNDGLTVGTVAGNTCVPNITTNGSFTQSFSYQLLYQSANAPYTYTPTASSGDCREISNVYSQVTLYEQSGYYLHTAMKFRSQVVGTVVSNADPLLSGYTVGSLPLVARTVDGIGFQSTWGYNNNFWNGTDPNAVSWVVEFVESSGDGDYLTGLYGRIDYKYGSSSNSPLYAAFGEVRASGTLYANSVNAYGDVAEFVNVIPSTRKPEPGDVVSISRNGSQAFVLSTSDYDPLLAGVISEKPSLLINSPSEGDPVALTGRVKVKVNLKGGVILPGDAITSSSQEGIGMKANKDGIILGYALEAFDGSRTDQGKIWILLSKGHAEKLSPKTKIEQVDEPELAGSLVTGSKKVKENESSVFVPWDNQLAAEMPADVEFDDLYVELTPFGGKAELIVKKVDSKGLYVEVGQRSPDFKGFYYKTDILSSGFLKKENKESARYFANYDDKLAYAKKLYSVWQESFKKLEQQSGLNFDKVKDLSFEQSSKFKSEASAKWQKNFPDLYRQWQDAGNEVTNMFARIPGLARQVAGN